MFTLLNEGEGISEKPSLAEVVDYHPSDFSSLSDLKIKSEVNQNGKRE